MAPENLTSFQQLNVLPLFQYLLDSGKLASSLYLGTAQFGTEAFHADGHDVTFEASSIAISIATTPTPTTAKTNTVSTKTQSASTKTNTASAKPGSPTAKSNAASLKEVEAFKWCWVFHKGAMGAGVLWFWML